MTDVPPPAPSPAAPEGAGQPPATTPGLMPSAPPAQPAPGLLPAQPAPGLTPAPPAHGLTPAPVAVAARPGPAVPPEPPPLARRWPGPRRVPRRPVLAAVLAAAAVSAVIIPLGRPGLGWLVSVAAGTAALATVAWSFLRAGATGASDRADPDPRTSPRLGVARLAWTAATVALLAAGTVRAAGWLFVLCLFTAGVTACLALTDGRSARGLLLSLAIPVPAVFRSLPWTAAGLRAPSTPGGRSTGRLLATLGVSLGLLVVFGSLLASADTVFARLIDGLLPRVSAGTIVKWIFLFVAVGAALLGAAFVLAAPPDLNGPDEPARSRVRRSEWVLPVALLDLLFAAFVLVQVTVLFGGSKHVLRTAGLTYAEYARGGFWQLLAVSALTLLVLAAAARWAPRTGRVDRTLIRVLLGGLALLSLVVVGSAFVRMNVYTSAYGVTRLRLLVATCELWLGLVFVLVLVAGIRLRARWLPRLVLGSGVLALLGLVALNPDRLIADRNVDRYVRTGRLDLQYLSELSADAVPAIDRLPAPLRDCALDPIAYDLRRRPDGWWEANLGRARARDLIVARPPRYVPPESRPFGC